MYEPLYTQVEAVRFEKSNCMRPPHRRMGYASGRTPGFHMLAISGYHHLSTKASKPTNGLWNQESPKNCARVHFIPNLMVGVFVILRAPYVIFQKKKCAAPV